MWLTYSEVRFYIYVMLNSISIYTIVEISNATMWYNGIYSNIFY